MENTKKLILVPENEFKHLKARREMISTLPVLNEAAKISQEMDMTLAKSELEPNLQLMQYNQLMSRYRTLLNKLNNTPQQTSPVASMENQSSSAKGTASINENADQIFANLPSRYREKAEHVLNFVRNKPELLRWSENGNIIHRGTLIQGTHIADLINDLMIKRKGFVPQGKSEFLEALARMNIPETHILNTDRRREIQEMKLAGTMAQATKSPEPAQTKKSNRKSPASIVQTRWLPY